MLDEISDWSQKITDLQETLCDLPTKSTDLSEYWTILTQNNTLPLTDHNQKHHLTSS
jgi:hypothetical protein